MWYVLQKARTNLQMNHMGNMAGLARVAAAAIVLLASPARAAADDPMQSPLWDMLAAKYLPGGKIVHDPAVKVVVPSIVENQAQVPITADARGVPNVVKFVVIADLNPIQHVLTLTPDRAEPYVAFRLKVEQGTPVRAAALTADGVWHVGSVFLDAAGGGCSAPAEARKKPDWASTLGEARGRIWRTPDGAARLRLRVKHPMDTGLAKDNTPAFYVERLDVKDEAGSALGALEMFEPVGEDPTVTLMVRIPRGAAAVIVDGRDNNGSVFRSRIATPRSASDVSQ